MRERFQLPMPFWRVQYQLLGGHRRVLFLTLLYASVVLFGAIALSAIQPQRATHHRLLLVG
jgi:hypothetical protein